MHLLFIFAALSFWENSRSKRLKALQSYLKKQEFRKELRLRGFEPESASDEDSPFAMYKHLDDKLEINDFENDSNDDYDSQIDKLKDSLQMTELDNERIATSKKLTVIDPGPSTSKSSVPWIDDNISEQSSATNKVKSIGRVREKVMKGKVQKKPVRKKKLSISEKNLNENGVHQSIGIENEDNSVHLENNDVLRNKRISNNANHQLKQSKTIVKTEKFQAEEMEIDEEVEESERLLSKELGQDYTFTSEKDKRKLEKREARKQEIIARLKANSQNVNQSNG